MTASRAHACAAALLCALALAAPLARAQFSWPEVANQDALQRGEVCAGRSVLPVQATPCGFFSATGPTPLALLLCTFAVARTIVCFAALLQHQCNAVQPGRDIHILR